MTIKLFIKFGWVCNCKRASTELILKLTSLPLSINFNTTILDVANFNLDDNQNCLKIIVSCGEI